MKRPDGWKHQEGIRFNCAGLDVRVTRNPSGKTYSVQVLYQNPANSLYLSKTKSVRADTDQSAIDKATEFAVEIGLANLRADRYRGDDSLGA